MKTIIQKIGCAAGILLLATASAGADEVDQALSGIAPQAVVQSTRDLIESGLESVRAIEVTRAMVQNRFDAQQISEAHQVLLNAQTQGLPPDPIINKAFEGMTKQVQASRIVGAMETVRARYDFALKQAMKFTVSKSQMNQMGHVIAACLTAGLPPKSVESITDGLQEQARTLKTDQQDLLAIETFKTARDMARLSVSPSQTEALIHQALQHQFSAAQMQNMRAAFRDDSRTTSSQSLAARYSRSIEQGKSFESPHGDQRGGGQSTGSSGGGGNAPGGPGPGGGSGSGSGGGSGSGSGGGSGGPGGGSGGSGPGGAGGSGS
ncbi:MAG: hypothetical protein PVH74_09325 [Desulfobacterales bacterium]|jgi:hypothetical protein